MKKEENLRDFKEFLRLRKSMMDLNVLTVLNVQ